MTRARSERVRARAERFGAIVAIESPPALVSVDRALARRIGVDGGALWEDDDPGLGVDVLSGPTEVHVAATERCPAGCTGCYADAKAHGREAPIDVIDARLARLAEIGAFQVAFGGGEPALRDDVGELARRARAHGLVPTMTTSGLGVTAARAAMFRDFAQVNVSWDGAGATYREVRGWDGAEIAERAIACLREAGVPVGVNTVVTRDNFDRLEAIAEGAERLGAVELQLLRWKPSGRARLDYLARRLGVEQIDAFPGVLRRISESRAIAIRVDCAMVPFLAADAAITPGALARFGVAGCEAGRSLMTLRAGGEVAPCSFWDGESGASIDGAAGSAWDTDASLEAFRRYAATPPEPCSSCAFRAVCRGGCRIVARHVTGTPWAPDPECPRVRAHRAAQNDRIDAT